MLSILPPPLRGVLAFTLLVLNTLAHCLVLFALALVKLVLRHGAARPALDRMLNTVATSWIAGNSGWMRLTQRTAWEVTGLEALERRGWYLVNANHQSWVDIFVLQHLLNRRVPLLKFFLKRELLWVPVMGLAWWALEFPFMRRHSDAVLRAHPEKRHEDLETARAACEKFARVPTSVMNFAEGTRFTAAKHAAQRSPYRHLLKPKSGALGLALGVLGERFHSLLDVTIVYPDGAPTFWDFLCGPTQRIVVRVHRREIPRELLGADYVSDTRHRKALQRWLQQLWRDKDDEIDAILAPGAAANGGADSLDGLR